MRKGVKKWSKIKKTYINFLYIFNKSNTFNICSTFHRRYRWQKWTYFF